MSDTFKIISSSNEAVDIVQINDTVRIHPSFIETFITRGDYGRIEFQKVSLRDFTLWISRYSMNYETVFYAEVTDPFMEAHITLKNRMVQSIGRSKDTILDNREFNVTYAPYLENKVLFPIGGEYMTFDIHVNESILQKWSVDFPVLEEFLNRRSQEPEYAIHMLKQRSFLDIEMEYLVRRILNYLSMPGPSRALTEALGLELLAMFLLRSLNNKILPKRNQNRHTDSLLHVREIIENEANTFDSEDLFSTEIQLADKVGLSIYQFKTGFKKLFGINPYKMNLELRLRKAQKLLRETGYPVFDIALKTGFQTSEGLIRAYKRYFKITPSMERLK